MAHCCVKFSFLLDIGIYIYVREADFFFFFLALICRASLLGSER